MTTTRRGFTLVEIMIAVTVLAILAALAVPSFQPSVTAQLETTAQVIAADLAQVRQLAVTYNSSYRITFDATQNRYYLEHSGTNSTLSLLPPTTYPNPANTPQRQYFDLDELPHLGPGVFLSRVVTKSTNPTVLTSVEFGPLGATTSTSDTVIWLSCGSGGDLRYIPIEINAVTGLAQIGELTNAGPTGSGS